MRSFQLENTISRCFSYNFPVPEEKENFVSRQLAKPTGLLSANSTPRSTPRTTPIRGLSPMPLAYRTRDGSKQRHAAHHRIAAPKFFAVPYNRLAEEGETVQFQCAVAGHPLPWSTWDRDGIIVMSTGRITVKEHDDIRTLEIEQVTADDAGLYRITIENEYGRMEATARLDVLPVRRTAGRSTMRASASPGRSSVPSSRRIMGNSTRIGGRLALACSYRGTSVPARRFYHNGEEVVADGGRVCIEHEADRSTLIVDGVRAEDAGVYTCLAQNRYGGMAASSTIVNFSGAADGDEPMKAPSFSRPLPARQACTEGVPVDLCCTVRQCGVAEPFEMTWWRNAELVHDSPEFRYIDHGDGLLTLRIADPFVLDAGEFVCHVRTDSGLECETSGHLAVEECAGGANDDDEENGLQFVKRPVPVMAFHGAVVTFCAKVWPLEAQVVWTICGRDVNESTRGIMVSGVVVYVGEGRATHT